MLYLNPPYVVVNGLTTYPDHADAEQWYYMPEAPRLAVRTDDQGRQIPAFSLLRFRSGAGPDGGLLTFDVDLHVDKSVLAAAAAGIQSALSLPKVPNLVPVPLEDGTVSLTVLTQVDDAAPGADPRFAVKIEHPAKPSLYGDNRAAFSAALDEDSSVLILKSLDGELTPIGVVYSLTFLALRPAYSVRLHIDWDRLQDRLDKEFGVDWVFLSTQISDAVDKLVDDRIIDLQVDTFVPEGEDTKSIITSRNRAVAEVRDMITDAFFTSSIDPKREPPDGWDKAEELLDTFNRNHASGGGLLPCFRYTNTHYSRIDQKRLNVTMNERVTVKRSIYPQAHLSGIAAAIRDSGLPRTPTFVQDIDLNDPWYKRRTVQVISRVDTGNGHISSVDAELRYHDAVRSVVIDRPDLVKNIEWPSVVTDGRMDMPVEASVVVNLKTVEDLQRPTKIVAPPQTINGEVFEVRTDDLFRLETVPIMAENVPWDRWKSVEVTLRYVDAAHGVHQESMIVLAPPTVGWNYLLFVMAGASSAFDYRVRYVGNDGRQDYLRDWVTTDEGEIRLHDPFPAKRTIAVVPQANWSEVDRILVDLRYQDPGHDIDYEQSLEFSSQDKATKTFSVDLQDPGQRRVGWQATFLYNDGRSAEVGWSTTTETRLIVRPGMPRHTVVLVAADFTGADAGELRDVVVTVAPVGSDNVLAELTFLPGGPPQEFGFDHTSDTDIAYRYKPVWHYTNGMRRTKDWTETRATDLAIGLN